MSGCGSTSIHRRVYEGTTETIFFTTGMFSVSINGIWQVIYDRYKRPLGFSNSNSKQIPTKKHHERKTECFCKIFDTMIFV